MSWMVDQRNLSSVKFTRRSLISDPMNHRLFRAEFQVLNFPMIAVGCRWESRLDVKSSNSIADSGASGMQDWEPYISDIRYSRLH